MWHGEHGCCHALGHSCDMRGAGEGMTGVLEAREGFDAARGEAKAMVDRERARLGLAMIRARESAPGRISQATIAADMKIGTQQVRAYEQAYRDWAKEHDGESLD